jgi:3',5'-cyclic AMP phosphodiesterase CpdA
VRRLIHLSDLHFGRDRPELMRPLIARVRALAPDLVVISGDLTQRARASQFRAARAFLAALEAPVLSVPGNHDIPLDNLPVRFFRPWGRYRRWISDDLEPEYRDEGMIVLGVNTVDRFAWQRGWFTRRALARVRRGFEGQGSRIRIVVAHHPVEHGSDERKQPMRGAEDAIEALSDCRADVILSGHLHSWRAEPFAHREGRSAVLQVHAGTGLSTRLRGEENDFNLLELSEGVIDVTRHAAGEGVSDFTPLATRRFVIRPEGWIAAES